MPIRIPPNVVTLVLTFAISPPCVVTGQIDDSAAKEVLSPIPSRPVVANSATENVFGTVLPSIEPLKQDWDVRDQQIQWDTAIVLAEFSILAYTDAHNRALVTRLMGFQECMTLDDGPMSGFLALSDDVIVVTFRGTNMLSPRDWMTNIDLFRQQRRGQGRKLHRGFFKAYDRFSQRIKTELRGRHPHFIWLTGHSLGGAVATCCACDWIDSRMALSGLITFGQPRVANPKMAEFLHHQLDGRYLRFRNGDDIVPTIPPKGPALISNYRHAGGLAWFENGALTRTVPRAVATDGRQDATEHVEQEITAEELIQFQNYLRTTQTPIDLAAQRLSIPPFDAVASAPLSLPAQPMTASEALAAQSRVARFDDHSMLEYLRLLNEFRARQRE